MSGAYTEEVLKHHMTYSEIGEIMGLSRQSIRNIEKQALNKLRNDPVLFQYYVDLLNSNSLSRNQNLLLSF